MRLLLNKEIKIDYLLILYLALLLFTVNCVNTNTIRKIVYNMHVKSMFVFDRIFNVKLRKDKVL